MIKVGSTVKVKPPFSFVYREIYVVIEKTITEDGQDVYFLEGIEGGFSPVYLEVVEEV